jgi:hypothetical protein
VETSVFYRNIENLTLKRDKLLSKLRKHIDKASLEKINYEELDDIIISLRKIRRTYIKLLKEMDPKLPIEKEYNELLRTLMEFTSLIALNDEYELIDKVGKLASDMEVDKERIDKLKDDINELKELRSILERFLKKM